MSQFVNSQTKLTPFLLGIPPTKIQTRISRKSIPTRVSTQITVQSLLDNLACRQRKSLHRKNEQQLVNEFTKLKDDLVKYAQTNQYEAQHFGDKTNRSRYACKGLYLPTEKVCLDEKYNAKLAVQLKALAETQAIEEYKYKFGKICDRIFHPIATSPNASKASFLIEKSTDIDESKVQMSILQPKILTYVEKPKVRMRRRKKDQIRYVRSCQPSARSTAHHA